MIETYLICLVCASFSSNAFLYYNLKHHKESRKKDAIEHQKELEALRASQQKEIIAPKELKDFIYDVMHGKLGMIAVTRVDPENMIYRSPRDSR